MSAIRRADHPETTGDFPRQRMTVALGVRASNELRAMLWRTLQDVGNGIVPRQPEEAPEGENP